MLTSAKINFKKYISLSLVIMILTYPLLKSKEEIYGSLIIFAAACLNQWMLVTSVREASKSAVTGVPANKLKMIIMILGKMFVLLGALTFAVHLMGNRVIIPLLIYVLQIAVLYLSLVRFSVESKD